jgi:S-layer homology domain
MKKQKIVRRLFNARIVVVLSILVLVISYLSFSGEKKFKDVDSNHWASEEINYLTEKQIIYGFPDGTFKPNNSITRLQAVFMILREKGISVNAWEVEDPGFADVKPGQSGYNEIAKAVELGIIHGKVNEKGQKVFDPQGTLTRSQMAKILVLANNLEGTNDFDFTDVPKNHWAYPYVQSLAKNKITTGYGDGRFGVSDYLTRAQFAVMMARILDESFQTSPTPTETSEPNNNNDESYSDSWVAPVLESTWNSNPAINYQTLEKELGFTDGGRVYAIDGHSQAIQVVSQGNTGSYEVGIKFMFWTDPNLEESYRIPIVAKELFKLYFDTDANRVWNYFNSNDIPDQFNANGRTVKASYIASEGAIYLEVGHK